MYWHRECSYVFEIAAYRRHKLPVPMHTSQKTILIIDDDSLYLDLIAEGLRLTFPEFLILSASSGGEALAIIEERRLNLVITDLCMPEVDGFDVLMKLKEKNEDVPTIVISGFGLAKAHDLARDFGTRLFLEKPVDFNTLSHAVRGIVQRDPDGQSIVYGFSLPSFLQLMELDGKTGALQIVSEANEGKVYFEAGTLTYAATGQQEGNQAIFEILGWPAPEIRISNHCESHLPNISAPLSSLLLEGCHAVDETNNYVAS